MKEEIEDDYVLDLSEEDFEKLKKSVEGPFFQMPVGLANNREEFRKWMKECADS